MLVDFESVKTRTTAVRGVTISGVPDMQADYVDRRFAPGYVVITYTYRRSPSSLAGWVEHSWDATFVDVSGRRILKPGKDGSQRLGQDTCKAYWSSSPSGNVQDDARKALPEWLDHLITELRPSGDLSMVGAE